MGFASLPTYQRIADELRRAIERGQLRPGDRLPAERALVVKYAVSRITVRHALQVLEQDGLVERRRGRGGGTFVTTIPPLVQLNRLGGFLPQLRARGMSVTSQVLRRELILAPERVRQPLSLDPGSFAFQVVRLRSVDGTPLLLENSFFPVTVFPDLLDHDLEGSLYELLGQHYGHPPAAKTEVVLPHDPNRTERELLKVPAGHLLLRIKRTALDAEQLPVEYSEDTLRSDLAQIQVFTS
ncbi:GntR family transcriptional regulator [Corynebacterium confusum]|uniref:GntR family transcriptional regulator n=1 Tax=Corynebacterium confusum TaxID=71254 RepID=UPI0025B33D17|nr:GntR family transcriptional regulator [Corynebacterium confusum]WJY88843.1 putative HTH-type transcriptional regulator YegW [Corynebacterium confusum]